MSLEQELNNLSVFGYIYYLDSDTLCENSVLYWTNHEKGGVDPCGYGSYTDTDYFLTQYPEINFRDYYVSFGEYETQEAYFPAAFIAHKKYKYLLVTNEPISYSKFSKFVPSVVLAAIFMLIL